MTVSPAMAAELQKPAVLMSYCLELRLPGYDLRLTDGGHYAFDVDGVSRAFVARDATYGVLGGVGQITDGATEGFPTVEVVLMPPTNAALAALAAPAAQGAKARVWVATLSAVTGLVIGAPYRRFKGWLNTASWGVGENERSLTLSLNSILAEARQADEGARLNDGFHQRAWPGERGLEFSQSIEQVDYWGSDTPRSAVDYGAAQRRMLEGLGADR